MIICPPELQLFDRNRYYTDLACRADCDLEMQAERIERIKLLLPK